MEDAKLSFCGFYNQLKIHALYIWKRSQWN